MRRATYLDPSVPEELRFRAFRDLIVQTARDCGCSFADYERLSGCRTHRDVEKVAQTLTRDPKGYVQEFVKEALRAVNEAGLMPSNKDPQ